ncbi:MAG: PorP/SprF family type IX secretion system membrane protein [Prolixibacteraceae bacterium]|nr:PorP/SprF family type IX secretion system membrane protein [Prolixibacteraceae bacterium]
MLSLRCVLKRTTLLFSLIIGVQSVLTAQDVYFSQFFMNPVYMNPAYAGTMKVPRAGVQYRNQWPAMNNAYTTYFASFDTYLPKITSGLGFLLFNDVQGDGIYTESSFKVAYSKEIRINRDWTMYGSLTAGAQFNSLNFDRLIFADGLDPIFGQHQPTVENMPDNNNKLFPDFGAGILLFNDKYFFGISADHLSEPDQSIYSNYSQILPRKYTTHLEVNLPWYRPGRWRKYCTFNPNIIVQMQGDEQNITYGLYANRKGFSLGLWNRQTTKQSSDIIVMAGFVGKQLKTAITYDLNLKGVGLRSQGAIELSISYLLRDPGKKSIFPFYEIPGEWDIR